MVGFLLMDRAIPDIRPPPACGPGAGEPKYGSLRKYGHAAVYRVLQLPVWTSRASIPVPLACKASALPFELDAQVR